MDLKCKKLNCKYNDKYACMSSAISVMSNLECATFEQAEHLDKGQLQDISKTMFEVAPDIHPFRHIKDVNVSCKASCLFNKDGKCVSNGITVASIASPKGVCVTNIEP